MIGGFRALFAAAMLALGAFSAVPATAGVLQCAPFAREVSGIEIFGNANTWWNQAAGRYDRGHEPRVGAVLSFASSRAMPVGHVAMVSKIISDREVLIDGKTTGGPDIDMPQALILQREPEANVERYDGLRARTAGGRHAS